MPGFENLFGHRKEVTCVCKDKDGDIIAIGASGWKHDKDEAIRNHENNTCEYYVKVKGQQVQIHVVPEENTDELARLLLQQPVKKKSENQS